MKHVLISINPKWCELIASGEKTIEVRKTRPKIDTPFKCYIYCTKGNIDICPKNIWWRADDTGFQHIMNGKVIGEFVCDEILDYKLADVSTDVGVFYYYERYVTQKSYDINSLDDCLTGGELLDYGNYKNLYGWHIFDLKIYDNPKELKTFEYLCPHKPHCETCKYSINQEIFCGEISVGCYRYLQHPPQSWCYVEEV